MKINYLYVPFIFSENHSLDVLALAAENESMKKHLNSVERHLARVLIENESLQRQQPIPQKPVGPDLPGTLYNNFGAAALRKSIKYDEFKYYTGLNREQFTKFYLFIVPQRVNETPFSMSRTVSSQKKMTNEDQVLLVMIKLRHNFDFHHIGHLFGISQQDASTIFRNWIQYMFHRCASVCIWPHRSKIIERMPDKFKEDFPNTLVIIDGTEMRIQRPSSMTRQSQSYSDYKSSNTLKGLVGIDPRGTVIFISMLFSGSISDKELTNKSGFLKTLEYFKKSGKVLDGDGVMVDKGFRIEEEVEQLGLKLNIPPFAKSGCQMSAGDIKMTEKIARHRVHVERAIARIKMYKILSNRVDLKLFASIGHIWYVCCFATNFMNFLIK